MSDADQVWKIFWSVIQEGDTYVFDPQTPKEDLAKHWFADYMQTYVAEQGKKVVGTYIIKPNQIGLGDHVANGSYMVLPSAQGQGIGKLLCEHSIAMAQELNFEAMQFNCVVSTNDVAIKLWKKFGFEVIGTTPKGFRHRKLGYVDTLIMYRPLR